MVVFNDTNCSAIVKLEAPSRGQRLGRDTDHKGCNHCGESQFRKLSSVVLRSAFASVYPFGLVSGNRDVRSKETIGYELQLMFRLVVNVRPSFVVFFLASRN